MAQYLHDKFNKKVEERFVENSIFHGCFTRGYSWEGVEAIKVKSFLTSELEDYQRSGTSRYGTPTDIDDVYQRIAMEKDRSFTKILDKGNEQDQEGLASASRYLGQMTRERFIPEYDLYVADKLAHRAGIIVSHAALTKTTALDSINEAKAEMRAREVPADGLTLWVPSKTYAYIRKSDEFVQIEPMAVAGIRDGKVGTLFGMTVKEVPESRWPEGVNFIIGHKDAAAFGKKLHDTKIHSDPPGISGHLLEGRFRYGGDVLGTKADGVYASVTGTVLAAPAISTAGAITGTSGVTFWYTTDGSDPRYSATRKTGAQSDVTKTGTIVKAYAEKSGSWDSPVATVTLA